MDKPYKGLNTWGDKDSFPCRPILLCCCKNGKSCCHKATAFWWVPEDSNLTVFSFYVQRSYASFPFKYPLQHPEPPVEKIPRTPIIPINTNAIKSRPFISNLISIPFLNFLAIVKDKVENNHNRPQIKDYERHRKLWRLWCG